MEVSAGATLNLGDITIANGRWVSAPTVAGAGILNFGTLTVNDTTFSGNDAGGGCCSGIAGGAIGNSGGTVTVGGSVFSGNCAGGHGGGIYSESGMLTVSNSTFSGNCTNEGGAAIGNAGGPATISNVTFSGNTSD
jgi:predicted outer membrane repeat protein